MVALIEGFPDHRQELAAPEMITRALFSCSSVPAGNGPGMDDRRHPGKHRDPVLISKLKIPIEIKPFHHHISAPARITAIPQDSPTWPIG